MVFLVRQYHSCTYENYILMTQVANKFEQGIDIFVDCNWVRNIAWVGVALGKQCHFIASKHEGKLNSG